MSATGGAGTTSERTIDQWREEIDRLDAQLVTLLNRRAVCALAIGKIKRRERQPIHVPERERAVIDRAGQLNTGPLPNAAIQAVFESMICQMRLLEANAPPAS